LDQRPDTCLQHRTVPAARSLRDAAPRHSFGRLRIEGGGWRDRFPCATALPASPPTHTAPRRMRSSRRGSSSLPDPALRQSPEFADRSFEASKWTGVYRHGVPRTIVAVLDQGCRVASLSSRLIVMSAAAAATRPELFGMRERWLFRGRVRAGSFLGSDRGCPDVAIGRVTGLVCPAR
jgi:hypothetical protein